MTCCKGPMDDTISNCWYMSLRLNFPLINLRASFSVSSCCSVASVTLASSDSRSPSPKSLATYRLGSNSSSASIFSPSPMNLMGAPVAWTAESAPPPFADPSNLVIIMDPISVASMKASACWWACWPIVPSMTRITSSGLTAFEIRFISSIRPASSLCLPAVSTMTRSIFLAKWETPSFANFVASFCSGSPKTSTGAYWLSCSYAPGLKVSAHTTPTLNPFFWKWRASFPQVVVFPEPWMPTMSSLVG